MCAAHSMCSTLLLLCFSEAHWGPDVSLLSCTSQSYIQSVPHARNLGVTSFLHLPTLTFNLSPDSNTNSAS